MSRRGVTLLEVVLMLLIALLALGLLLPATVKVRDGPSARSRAQNNLKQLALAVHNYNDAYRGKLPPLVDVGPDAPVGAGLNSIFFNLLPYIEQDNVFRKFQKTSPSTYYDGESGLARTIVPTFINTGDRTAHHGAVHDLSVELAFTPPVPFAAQFSGRYGTTSFAANGMIFDRPNGSLEETFKDGTSNTIMFAERPQVCRPASGPPVYNLWAFGYYGPSTPAFGLLTPDTPVGMPSTGQFAPATPLPNEWTAGAILVRLGRTDAEAVSSPVKAPFQTDLASGKPCDPRLPGTPFRQAMLVGLGDGRVRSVDATISQWTFWAACTPAGNETLRADW